MIWMCPECHATMMQITDNRFICHCGTEIIQLELFESEGDERSGANKND